MSESQEKEQGREEERVRCLTVLREVMQECVGGNITYMARLPQGYLREEAFYDISPDGMTLQFSFVDKQAVKE